MNYQTRSRRRALPAELRQQPFEELASIAVLGPEQIRALLRADEIVDFIIGREHAPSMAAAQVDKHGGFSLPIRAPGLRHRPGGASPASSPAL